MHYEIITGLSGLALSEDHGNGVTRHDWIAARYTEMEKGKVFDASRALFDNGESNDNYMREHLYSMKLQCLHAALIQNSSFDIVTSKRIAEAINAGFDAVK